LRFFNNSSKKPPPPPPPPLGAAGGFLNTTFLAAAIGGGAFGSVFKGIWGGTTAVALKMLRIEDEMKKEFEAEASILKSLHHPHIVAFLGIYEENGVKYICTEFLPEGSLESLLRKQVIPWANCVSISMEIVAGMSFLASHHIIHRDLASRNVLCKKEGERFTVKVGDFGLSRATTSSSDYYKSSGKRFPYKWTAPESMKYSKYSTASDVWSFGVTLWEITSRGEIPYFAIENREILKHLEEGYRLPMPDQTPEELYTIMKECWDLKPEKRPTWSNIFSRMKVLLQNLGTIDQNLSLLSISSEILSSDSY